MQIVRQALLILLCAGLTGCAATGPNARKQALIEVARSDQQWTGVAVSREGRLFVNYPLWGTMENSSVWEILPSGAIRPYPTPNWNVWNPSLPPADHFVCVQTVYADRENQLWILDAANPRFEGVVAGGPKLVQVDLDSNEVVRKILFDATVAPPDSYLNDVRVDTVRNYAYITDSGAGALVVVDLTTGRARRVLDQHSSTEAENIAVTIEDEQWQLPDGSAPRIHADGLALTADGEYLYYQALTGRTLYRIDTLSLRDETLSSPVLGRKVQYVDTTGPADGILFGPGGNLYLTAIQDNAIRHYTPAGSIETVVEDPQLQWPDTMALGPDDFIYVTTSRIHLGFSNPGPYRLFKFKPDMLK